MTSEGVFEASQPILLRFSTLAPDDFDVESMDLDSETPPDVDQLLAYIRNITELPVFREAVEVSSSSLGDTLGRIEAGERLSRKKLLRTAITLTRYMLRMTGRPTPFGLQAGVAEVHIGDEARVSFCGGLEKHVRLDAGWFQAQTQKWLHNPRIRSSVKIILNDLCYVRGERLVLPSARAETASHEASIRRTRFVEWVCGQTVTPRPWSDLVECAVTEFHGITPDKIDHMLQQLVANEFLLTSLAPRAIDADFIATVCDLLNADPAELDEFAQVLKQMDEYNAAALGEGIDLWRQLQMSAGASKTSPGVNTAQVDLTVRADVVLPRQVLEEIERCASMFWTMTQTTPNYSHMREYRDAFTFKYGRGGAVPLPELIDPHRGLGFPRGYQNPRVAPDARLQMHQLDDSAYVNKRRIELLNDLIITGILSEKREIVLTPHEIKQLTTEKDIPPPSSFEIGFQVLAEDVSSLDSGDYQLLAAPLGSSTAGASMGRFARMAGIQDKLGELMAQVPEDDGIVAQISFRPLHARNLNVSQVPGLLPYEIPVGQYVDANSDRVLDWKKLIAVERDGELLLVHGPTASRVHPYVPNMLNLDSQAPNVARLLAEFRHTGPHRIVQIWNWHQFLSAPWLPRLKMGKLIISPLTWRPSVAMPETAMSRTGWDKAVEQWRQRHRVSDRVCVTKADRTYEIDLRKPFHRELLRREISQASVTITESPRDLGSYGWIDGRANEIVVPLLSKNRKKEVPSFRDVPRVQVQHYSPGSEWFYAQIVAVPEAQDDLICRLDRAIRQVANDIDTWHYVRYTAPDPHLRLRVRTRTSDARSQLFKLTEELREDGVIREFRLCAYEPEENRYGGKAAHVLAEELFAIDSFVTASQLDLLRSGRSAFSKELVAVLNGLMLLDNLGSLDWLEWVCERMPRFGVTDLSQEEVKRMAQFATPGTVVREAEKVLGLPVVRMWEQSSAPAKFHQELHDGNQQSDYDAAVLSFLHMQHNRLIGPDRASEMRVMALIHHVGRLHLGRRLHGAGQGCRL